MNESGSPVEREEEQNNESGKLVDAWCSDVSRGVAQSACIVPSNDRAGRADLQVLLLL